MHALPLTVAGEALCLLSERAIAWPARRSLLVADLHWGKDESFRRRGTALPAGILGEDLGRLRDCILEAGAETLYVLGDLLHNRDGMSGQVIEEVAEWRRSNPLRIVLTPGNHDRHVPELPGDWRIENAGPSLRIGPFRLQHEAAPHPGDYTLGGHLHPCVRLQSATDRLRLPCFLFGQTCATLPAFSRFTGGSPIERKAGDRVFAITEERVVDLNPAAGA